MRLTFKEFEQSVIEEFKSVIGDEPIFENYTLKETLGHSEVLYAAQFMWHVVELNFDQKWFFHFNGFVGVGNTLSEAVKDHDRKYNSKS